MLSVAIDITATVMGRQNRFGDRASPVARFTFYDVFRGIRCKCKQQLYSFHFLVLRYFLIILFCLRVYTFYPSICKVY